MNKEYIKGDMVEIKKILPYKPYQDEIVIVDSTHTYKIEAWRIECYREMLAGKANVESNLTGSYIELILNNLHICAGFSDEEIQEIKDDIICPFDFREYIVDWTQRDIKPSMFVLETETDFCYNFRQYEIDTKGLSETLNEILRSIKQNEYEDSLTYDSDEGKIEELQSEVERLEDIIKVCKDKMHELGISDDVLESIFNGEHKTPALFISLKNKILINNQVVHMAPLDKAVYLLFLNHPEGINFSNLPDYREELLETYRRLMNYHTSESMIKSINNVVDPTHNSINEACVRIRKAFIAILGKYWAEPYCITGKRGEVKKIALNRSLILTEEEQIKAQRREEERLWVEMHSSYVEPVSTSAVEWAKHNSISLNEFDFIHREWCFRKNRNSQWWKFEFSENKILCNGQLIGTYDTSPMTLNINETGDFKLISILHSNQDDYRAVFLSEDGAHVISPTTNPKMLTWTLEKEMEREERTSLEQPSITEHTPIPPEHSDIDETPEDLPF